MTATSGYCAKCNTHYEYLMPLHGERGGPSCCLTCVGAWHAEHGRKRNRGRVAMRAIKGFLAAGGTTSDLENLKTTVLCGGLYGIDPLHYLHDAAALVEETIELTSELLNDALLLTHPDKHPPERKELAQRVTGQLLALKPFVFPAKEAPKWKPQPNPPRDGSEDGRRSQLEELLRSVQKYPCPTCASTVPYYYCDPCKAEYRKRQEEKATREAKKAPQAARRPQGATSAQGAGAAVRGLQ
jgi:hypothetical protein